MTHHHSRFDRYLRIMKRTRIFLKSLNNHSDRIMIERDMTRCPEAEKQYNQSKRLILDIEKELAKL